MIINVDNHLPKTWDRSRGDRVFEYDVFLSHNEGDQQARELAESLRAMGVVVWHDAERDLSDRRVRSRINQALLQSRFVALCVPDGFRDSPWCQAEYLPAIAVGAEARTTRLVVVCLSPDAPVPETLRLARRFEAYGSMEGLNEFAAFVRRGNTFGPLPPVVAKSGRQPDELRSELPDIVRHSSPDQEEIWSGLVAAVTDGPRERHPQLLMALRQAFIEVFDVPELSARERRFATQLCECILNSDSSDDRANAFMILRHLAAGARYVAETSLFLGFLADEPDSTLMRIGLGVCAEHWERLTPLQRAYAELCALRDRLDGRVIGERLSSEAARVMVFVKGLGELEAIESVALAEKEMERLLAGGHRRTDGSQPLDTLHALFGVNRVEVVFRELSHLMFDDEGKPRADANQWAGRYVRLVERVCEVSEGAEGVPLLAMEEWVSDFVLVPLMFCASLPSHVGQAREVHGRVCELIAMFGTLKGEVSVYRDALDEVPFTTRREVIRKFSFRLALAANRR